MVKYDDMVQLCDIQTPDKCQSTKISRVSYKLVAVVVHTGNKLFSGHYVCYMKRNWSCYFADDTHIKRCSTIEAINEKTYLKAGVLQCMKEIFLMTRWWKSLEKE